MIGVSHFYWRFSGSWVPWGINQQNTITTNIHSSYLQLKPVNCTKASALWDILRYISLLSKSNSGNKSNSLCLYSEFSWSVFSRIWDEYGEILPIFSPNAGKCGPKKLRIRTFGMNDTSNFNFLQLQVNVSFNAVKLSLVKIFVPAL